MPAKQSILVGSPRPAKEVLVRLYIDPADVEAVKSIPEGYAQETTLGRNRAVSLIAKMERMELIPRGTYSVRAFHEGDKTKLAIVHEGADQESRTSEVPTAESIAAFIESQQDFRHDSNLVAQHFFGRVIDSHTDGSLYRRTREATIRARQLMEKKHGGKFAESNVGHRKYYAWSKD